MRLAQIRKLKRDYTFDLEKILNDEIAEQFRQTILTHGPDTRIKEIKGRLSQIRKALCDQRITVWADKICRVAKVDALLRARLVGFLDYFDGQNLETKGVILAQIAEQKKLVTKGLC